MKTYTVNFIEAGEGDIFNEPEGTVIFLDENGYFHCEHGPAVIRPWRSKSPYRYEKHYWHGMYCTLEEWKKIITKHKKHTVTLEDGTKITLSHESYENLKKGIKA